MTIQEPPLNLADMAALGKLFDDHRPQLLAVVRQRLDPALSARLDPDDLLHQAFLKACQRWADFPRSGMNSFTWLRRIVLDCLYDEYDHQSAQRRDYHREAPLPDGSSAQFHVGMVSPGTSPSEAFARGERKERLAAVLSRLEPQDQEILRKIDLDGQPFSAAAQALGITEGSARVRHLRALRRLKNLWKTLYGSEGLES